MIDSALYCCALPGRLANVRQHNDDHPGQALNAIDYVEIASPDQRTLLVWCLLPAGTITRAHVRVDGGVRIKNIGVTSVTPETVGTGNRLRLQLSAAGDFSDYALRLVDPAAPDEPAPGFDSRLAQIAFSFKAQCPSVFDCRSVPDCAGTSPVEPVIDYLAKDYTSFRQLILDRLGVLVPGFAERNPADVQVALVEVLAYAADQLSYYQDAVATDAYLGTARSRISLRRHARLLDYPMHDGCNARAWVTIALGSDIVAPIPAHQALITRGSAVGAAITAAEFGRSRDASTLVFETLYAVWPTVANNVFNFYTWSDDACWLAAGATRATLLRGKGQTLASGDVLILEEVIGTRTGLVQDADRTRRWAVRLVTVEQTMDTLTALPLFEVAWADADALPFALCVSARIGDALQTTSDVSVATGNVVLVDHGEMRRDVALVPSIVPDAGVYAPRLPDVGIAYAVTFDVAAAAGPATSAVVQDPRAALPADAVLEGDGPWSPRRDLLASNRFSTEFVVETENDGTARLRFGDGRNGQLPKPGLTMSATYRVGGGSRGNVGAEAITRMVTDDAALAKAVAGLRNPLPAVGGCDPELPEQVRQYAPQAFRGLERAVTEDDFARVAERYPDVQRAVATLRWTGSWYTVYLSVDRRGGRSASRDDAFNDGLVAYIDRFRLAGYDVEVRDPVYAPLDIALRVCVQPNRYAVDVEQALLRRFGTARDGGRAAFFNPDNFTFADPLYLSRLIAAALDVDGVASVKALTFQRWGKTANGELASGVIRAAPLEVLRLDNDPNFPENGRIVFVMLGGL